MLFAMLTVGVLVAVTVVMHATGLSLMIWSMTKSGAALPTQTWRVAWLLIRVAWVLILIHTSEVMVWALFYLSVGCLPNLESALYFSGVTYTTIGYGDLVLKEPWRFLALFEGMTGILMCGWSASSFYLLGSKIYATSLEAKRK